MSSDGPSSSPLDPDPHSSRIRAARAQVEAARLRGGRLGGLPRPGRLPTLARYTLKREIHRGGQGIVYLGVQESTGREVAVKILGRGPLEGSSEGLARFEREVESLSLLQHPNVVTIHDCGRDHDHVFLVMDYIRGRPLDEYVRAERAPVRATLGVFARICDGVNAAHLRGVIHRDLKPGNILVDARGEPHILDFGLAKPTVSASTDSTVTMMTETGRFVGSLPWASPEQAEGRSDRLDIRTDVYSLGVVLYQALTGSFPYPVGGSVVEVVRHITGTPPARPAPEIGIDRELETILFKCLAKEPERRYQSAGEVARDLRRYLAGEPIEARRESLAYIMGKRLERYRLTLAAAAAVLLLLAVALVASVALWRRADDQRIAAARSATAAQDAARRADRKAEESRAVLEFMREVLTSVEPENLGADVRLIQVLAMAAGSASDRFGASPGQEAEVRELLGQAYFKLSMWQEAKAQFGLAAELWRRTAGPDDPRTLKALGSYVRTLFDASGVDEAEENLNRLLPRIGRVLDPDDPTALEAERSLALVHMLRGRTDEAEARLTRLRAHPSLADQDEAQIAILSGLVAVHIRRLSTDDAGRRPQILAAAEPLAQEWVRRSTRANGPRAAATLYATVRLADLLRNQGRYEEASEACRRILDTSAGRLGECHIVRANALYILADAMGGLGREQEAADLYLRAIQCMRQQYPAGHPAVLAIISDTLRYLERAGRAPEGETLARELAASLRGLAGSHGDLTFNPDLFVAAFVSQQGRLDEAEALFLPLLQSGPRQADPRDRARLHTMYAGHLVRRGSYEDAQRHLNLATAEVGDILQGTWDTHPDDIILAYITLYRTWNKADKAAEYVALRATVR